MKLESSGGSPLITARDRPESASDFVISENGESRAARFLLSPRVDTILGLFAGQLLVGNVGNRRVSAYTQRGGKWAKPAAPDGRCLAE